MNAGEQKEPRARASDTFTRTVAGLGRLVEAVTPWLLDLGGWIFGVLLAFNLVVLGALLTVGPVDAAVKVATASFALALPVDATGFLLLRLVADMRKVSLGDVATKAFVEVGFGVEGAEPAQNAESRQRRVALRASYGLLAVSVLLTLVGVTAALWHMGWWIGLIFIAAVAVSQAVLWGAISAIAPAGRWHTAAGEVEPPKAD